MASVANYNLKKLIVLILLTSVLSSCKTGGVGRSFFSASNSEKKIANDLKFIDAIAEKNTGNYEKSIVLFEEILKSKDNPAPAHFELSKLYWQKSNDDKAIQHINSAVDLIYLTLPPRPEISCEKLNLVPLVGLKKLSTVSYETV